MRVSMKLCLMFSLICSLLGGCQAFVEFDPDLLDGGDASKSLGEVGASDVLDAGVAD